MSTEDRAIDEGDIRLLLRDRVGLAATDVRLIGTGAWSRCFGFRTATADLVVRVGAHADDFERDRLAHRYCSDDLPIPEVVAIGEALGGWFAVSTRVHGTPLEACTAAEWTAVMPAVLRLLAALRDTEPLGSGFGIWSAPGDAEHAGWRSFLLEIGTDEPHHRIHGWREKLRASEGGDRAFARSLQLLDEVATDDVPRSLIHCDLINRNVHVAGGTVTGVFDWGCSAYGDHLLELAWFDFWSPWYPALDLAPLMATMSAALGSRVEQRYLACLLYIGLGHLAYNAHLGDWTALDDVQRRLDDIVARHR